MCGELHKIEDARRNGLWCDGLVPEAYDLDGPLPCIRGRAWIGYGPSKQEKWEFSLLVGRDVRSRDDIDWSALLPAEDLTGWLTHSVRGKTLVMIPRFGS